MKWGFLFACVMIFVLLWIAGAFGGSAFPEPPQTEHTWIQKNPDYKLRMPSTSTHCCSQHHCRMLNPGQVLRQEDGYVVLPSPPFLNHAEFVPQSEVYYTEAEGEGQFWACVVMDKVRCLFVPALGF